MDRVDKVAALLREAADLHHRVYRLNDGADPDWAWWYADWLVRLSELPEILGPSLTRSELTHELVALDRESRASETSTPWEEVYARRLVERFTGA